MHATAQDNESIVGDECHIVARRSGWSRGDPRLSEEELDEYDNLILLCRTHHKMVDDQPNTYTVDVLKDMKRKHENWVRETLQRANTGEKQQQNPIAIRVLTGMQAFAIVVGADAFDFSNDELEDKEEMELISNFLQTLQDCGELGEDMEVGERVKTGFELTQDINNLDNHDFWVFGVVQKQMIKVADKLVDWSVAVIRIVRKTNLNIVGVNIKDHGERTSLA